ncbi:ABC transporter ATP-binding protein [Bradyrhizobium sp. LHD-71]|uniref:ABC transporter ATP-binding protein n=1 Tax=Bradyrhizobium sp. LHD-71 TaxID=3072141 RepID=UPI00281081F3|nr:ABC transporter ATP-binding protein [Bradyrhizobium sp. LHD-71]MDQ8728347.1 ABC transporter ATP-binding protein [Bradyrhizobium sp. LHD-71]
MTQPAISLRSLNKVYRVWNHPRDLLLEGLTGRARHYEFQALTDISFDVPKGSVVGLLGRNGAGKSTLLRIVAGTLDASSGHVRTDGRIAAILELGTGFHPDYTGRENVFLGGLCLGLPRREIERRFDEIVDFAELRDFIDHPFRTYSSGMQARLTFAVATCVDPDILIIDEALGVGDARFQLKSFDRIRQFKERGKSILLVSHNIAQIVAICDRAILLEQGRVLEDGDPNTVGKIYHELLFAPPKRREESAAAPSLQSEDAVDAVRDTKGTELDLDAGFTEAASSETRVDKAAPSSHQDTRERRYGLREIEITDVWIENNDKCPVKLLQSLETYRLVLRLRAKRSTVGVNVGFLVRDGRGNEVFGWDTASGHSGPIPPIEAGQLREIRIAFRANLSSGNFFITAAVANPDSTKQDVRFDCMEFVVAPTPSIFSSSVVNLDVRMLGAAV